MPALPKCTKCSAPLPVEQLNLPQPTPCPGCGSDVQVEVFPACFETLSAGQGGEALLVDSESSCFYHEQKRAAVVCSGCGRFLCTLCNVELDAANYCPSCFESSRKKGKIASVENSRLLRDSMAFQAALFSTVLWPFSLLSAPFVLWYARKHWNSPSSITRNSKARMIWAVSLSGLQILAWLSLLAAFLLDYLK